MFLLKTVLALLGSTGVSSAKLRRLATEHVRSIGDWTAMTDVLVESGGSIPPSAWIDRQLHLIEAFSIDLLARGDADYPDWLGEIPDAPLALFVRGRRDALARGGIAVVGSRKCSAGGEEIAYSMGKDLAAAGLCVVSGLALGIDGAAHRGALEVDGVTVAVLGAGHGHLYPRRHRGLAETILGKGAIVSEHPPDTTPRRHYFPERNRIISGLARAVVVIEAGERSGSLITARLALEQGRDVMAVPGVPITGKSRGCHRLIQSGAALVEDSSDVLAVLGMPVPARIASAPNLDVWSARVLAEVGDEWISVDALAERVELPISRLLETLVQLELDGFVKPSDGGYIRRPR